MSSTATTLQQPMSVTRTRLADYVELTKPRISVLELVCVVTTMRLAIASTGGGWNAWVTAVTVVGTGLLAASANALNMYLERVPDGRMRRTANRPLPAGRLRPIDVAVFGVACLAVGVTLLALGVNAPTAATGLLSWFLYVAVYTPMKKVSTLNTFVGAVSGALPVVMGWTAGGGQLDLTALGLFMVLLIWQYPHFMAIAWLCREDYSRAGYQMSTTADPTGAWAGAQAVAGALLLLPASLLPAIGIGAPALVYAVAAAALMLLQLLPAVRFYRDRNDTTARKLMRASLIYIPLWLLAMTLCLP